MSIVVSYRHTMAGAKRLVQEDQPKCDRTSRFDRLAAASRRWQAQIEVRALRIEKAQKSAIEDAVAAYEAGTATGRQVVMAIAHKHGLTRDDLVGRSRARHVVKARQEAMVELHKRFKIAAAEKPEYAIGPDVGSLKWIGKVMGGRDHSTVMHALRKAGLK